MRSKMHNVFVYGSLLNSHSASHLLGQEAGTIRFRPARLENWRHVFDIQETVKVRGQEMEVAFLNIEMHPGSVVLGQLLTLSTSQLQDLKKRERQYDLIEVSVYDASAAAHITAFTVCGSKKNWKLPILEAYLAKVEKGALEHGTIFARDFLIGMRASLQGRQLIKGDYQFVNEEQNQLSGVKS